MKDVTEIETISKEEAEELIVITDKIVTKTQYLKTAKRVYEQIAKGMKIIDIFEVFKNTGLDDEGLPKLAIARADRKKIFLTSMGNFQHRKRKTTSRGWIRTVTKIDVSVPRGTFEGLKKAKEHYRFSTLVPIIPTKYHPKDDLKNYYILWEVESWEEEEIMPEDPLLLQRLSKNLFVVLAEWDLTPLEQSIMRGL